MKTKKLKRRPKVVGVDFDGTLCQLHPASRPYVPKRAIQEKPNRTVVEACKKLKKSGVRVVIYSSRWWGDYHWIKEWLDRNRIPYDDIVLGKFKADAFIDDTTVNPQQNSFWQKDLLTLLK